jgi:Tfp pilus assembly protein PilZ
VVREADFVRLGTRAIDVSADGMFLMTEMATELGLPVILTFEIPNTDVWVDAEGHVARVAQGRRVGDFAMGLGIAFDKVDDEGLARLRTALKKLPPVLPGAFGSAGVPRRPRSHELVLAPA